MSVTFETPLFSTTCWWIRLPFYVLNKQGGRFDFFEKKIEFFLRWSGTGMGSAWFSGSAWFTANSSSPGVFNFLAWKPPHMVNLTSKMGLTMTMTKNLNFFQKIKPFPLLVQHVKGQPDSPTYVQKKGCPTFDTNRGTPCSWVEAFYIQIIK